TREFYFLATRPHRRWDRFRDWATFPLYYRLMQYRNFGFQDARVLGNTSYDKTERFSEFDVETIGWRSLAILSAIYRGRHDHIPPEVIAKFKSRDTGTGAKSVTHGERCPVRPGSKSRLVDSRNGGGSLITRFHKFGHAFSSRRAT